ncbi:MAG: hypothetical protein H6719_30045 [Sandaracinaceae bacterium]|nr:hypothetical protein [Sandaracinaceae bacterium]
MLLPRWLVLALVVGLLSACGQEAPAPAAVEPEPAAPVPAEPPAQIAPPARPLVPPTREQVGGECASSDTVALGSSAPRSYVRVAASPTGALVAWQGPDGARARPLAPDGRLQGEATPVELDGPLIGLERVADRFVAVSGHGALRVLDDAGRPVGAPFAFERFRRDATVSHGGEYRDDGWRGMDVLSFGDTVAIAYAYDASVGGAVMLRAARVTASGFEALPPVEVGLPAGALRGWESTDHGGLGLVVGADDGEGPTRWLGQLGHPQARLQVSGGAIRRFARFDGGYRFLVAQRGGAHTMVVVDDAGARTGSPTTLPEGAPLPEPWGALVYTRLWVQQGGADFLRRDAALRPIGEPVAMGRASEEGEGAIAWSGEAFLVAWPDGDATVQLRAVVCQAP